MHSIPVQDLALKRRRIQLVVYRHLVTEIPGGRLLTTASGLKLPHTAPDPTPNLLRTMEERDRAEEIP
jgi:hypothetical protein